MKAWEVWGNGVEIAFERPGAMGEGGKNICFLLMLGREREFAEKTPNLVGAECHLKLN